MTSLATPKLAPPAPVTLSSKALALVDPPFRSTAPMLLTSAPMVIVSFADRELSP